MKYSVEIENGVAKETFEYFASLDRVNKVSGKLVVTLV